MGFSLVAYVILAATGLWMRVRRQHRQPHPDWLRPFHFIVGAVMAGLVLLLLAIGLVGTLGHYGSLMHSGHFWAGFAVVDLVFLSAWSAVQIRPDRPWARRLHLGINFVLLVGFAIVSLTGWSVVQKYLP